MKSDVWMPIVIGDYLGDTQRLSTEQHGAFLLLLMDYWRNGPPPADDEILRTITRLKPARFRTHKKTLLAFFTVADGKLINKRADAEKARAIQQASNRSAKAAAAADARWHGANEDAPSNAPSNAQGYAPECPSPSPSFSKEKAADTAGKLVFSEGVKLLAAEGSSPASARSLLGSLRKKIGDAQLAKLIEQATKLNISEPRAWLIAAADNPALSDGAGLTAAILNLADRRARQEAA